jgi:hypothetical protein
MTENVEKILLKSLQDANPVSKDYQQIHDSTISHLN